MRTDSNAGQRLDEPTLRERLATLRHEVVEETDRLDIARALVRAGQVGLEAVRSAFVVYATLMSTLLAVIVVRDHASLSGEEFAVFMTFAEFIGVVVLSWPAVAVLVWFLDQFLRLVEDDSNEDVEEVAG
jgi:predicted RecB family endonuclease